MYPESYGKNVNFPSHEDFKLVKHDDKFGLGIITYRSFEPGELVAELAGEIVTEMTQHTLQIEPGIHLLDLCFCGYFLHSCDPNVILDMQRMRVIACRPIQKGDYITMDYAQTEHVLFKQFPCSCGAAKCRGWITGSREFPDVHDPDFQAFFRKLSVNV